MGGIVLAQSHHELKTVFTSVPRPDTKGVKDDVPALGQDHGYCVVAE